MQLDGTTEMELEGTTELKDQSAKYACKVMMAGKFMTVKAELPPKGYHFDKHGRLRNNKTYQLQTEER